MSKFFLLLLVSKPVISGLEPEYSMLPENPQSTGLCPRYSFWRPGSLDSWPDGCENGSITVIGEDNWEQLLSGEWLLLLCSQNQPDCRDLEMSFFELATTAMGCIDVGLAFGDLSTPSTLRRRFSAFGQVTIYHILDGEFRRLSYEQDLMSLRYLIHLREWEDITPMPFWKNPTSPFIIFSIFAYKSAIDLMDSGLVGEDPRVATYTLSFLFAALLTWGTYFLWIGITCFVNYCKRRLHPELDILEEDFYEEGYGDEIDEDDFKEEDD
uniref:Thioredoxin-related transmembrane protein 1 n=1 Tax=Drosophila rhopaloa TaxID=1041015 RepID=A0A6P4FK67_DRORH